MLHTGAAQRADPGSPEEHDSNHIQEEQVVDRGRSREVHALPYPVGERSQAGADLSVQRALQTMD